jgi:tRNA A37 threonylcarbamoyladenosine dehydratase
MRHDLRERFAGIDRLYGKGAVERLDGRRVAVVGLGGVGAWAAEAFARSGVGHLTLIDADDLCLSNTNRQLPALAGNYGRNKAEAMAERCRAIHPGSTSIRSPISSRSRTSTRCWTAASTSCSMPATASARRWCPSRGAGGASCRW